jgi:hypothetical protein
MRNGGARFLQSARDFPMMVSLGSKSPSWELNRWGRNALRFAPFDGGGYSLRGDKWSLQYSGEKQSHRFAILDNEHFEYDIILNSEPESNRLYLGIEGWEAFDFLRQPDTTGPDILRGSYAVYKKEGVINSPAYHVGTGKICHIHRPKIIDARGRQVWGDTKIDKGVMTLTVPETWLGEAKYPVVVDPVIGSNTAGAYLFYDYLSNALVDEYIDYIYDYIDDYIDDYGDYDYFLEQITSSEWIELYNCGVFNKYSAPSRLQGTYNTHMYVFIAHSSNCFLYPLIYSDFNNKPKQLLNYGCTPGYPLEGVSRPTPYTTDFTERWVHSTITMNDSIAEGTDIWLGHFGDSVVLRFDYGAPLYRLQSSLTLDYDYATQYNSVRAMLESRQFLDIGGIQDIYADPNSDEYNIAAGARHDMKISMYLEINSSAYVRTLTQGAKLTDNRKTAAAYKKSLAQAVKLTDARKLIAAYIKTLTQGINLADTRKSTGAYKRTAAQTVKGATALRQVMGFYRICVMNAQNTTALKCLAAFVRAMTQQLKAAMAIGNKRGISLKLLHQARIDSAMARKGDSKRIVTDTGTPGADLVRQAGMRRIVPTTGGTQDALARIMSFPRRIIDSLWPTALPRLVTEIRRKVANQTGASGSVGRGLAALREAASPVAPLDAVERKPAFMRAILNSLALHDTGRYPVVWLRRLPEIQGVGDTTGHIGNYVRGLYAAAGSLAETSHAGAYRRKQADTANSQAASLRHLFVFIRLLSVSFIRDFIIRRFLKSNEDLILKSCVCRELFLDSSIH